MKQEKKAPPAPKRGLRRILVRHKQLYHYAFFIGCSFLFVIFTSQLFTSRLGLPTWYVLRQETARLHAEVAALKKETAYWETVIKRLHGEHMDRDFIDELIRKQLAYARDGEQLIYVQ